MAIPIERAQNIAQKLREWHQDLKVEIKGSENQVIAIAKQLTLRSQDLASLADIGRKQNITFGRSGANFRMIIW